MAGSHLFLELLGYGNSNPAFWLGLPKRHPYKVIFFLFLNNVRPEVLNMGFEDCYLL